MMSGIKLQIINEINNRDFLPWVDEKLHKAILYLCSIKHDNLTADENNTLYGALDEMIKLYAAITGENEMYDPQIVRFVFDFGIAGLDCVDYVFKQSSLKGRIVSEYEDNNTIDEMFDLITPDKSNRTPLNDKLNKLKDRNAWIERLEIDLDKVNLGEETWEWFYETHKNDDKNNFYISKTTLPEVLRLKIKS